MIIDGKKIAQKIFDELKKKDKPKKFFGAALIGSNLVSANFLKQKEKIAQELGVDFRIYKLPTEIKTDELRREIRRLAGVKPCGGFIVQLPLPSHINRHYALNAIPKEKDPDFLSEAALGAFYTGRHKLVPPSVGVLQEILRQRDISLERLRQLTVCVLGFGFLIGKPIGFWLQDKVGELVIIDEKASHLRPKLKEADIVISGVGIPNLFNVSDLKNGAIVVDFGFDVEKEKVVGDFDCRDADSKDILYTPTPGGTGPILVAKLFENFYALNAL